MNLRECFEAFGGDYEGVMGRLMTEQRVTKFLKMFVNDDNFANLCSAMSSGDYETAFRCAHTLKGMCANLGITNLQNSSGEITELLRGGVNNGADGLLPQVEADYKQAVDAISCLS